MVEVKVDSVILDGSVIKLGCVLVGPKRSWIRFTIASVPLDMVPLELIQEAILRLQEGGSEDGEPLTLF
jgi:hypothetical protein